MSGKRCPCHLCVQPRQRSLREVALPTACMIFFVLVLCMRTMAVPGCCEFGEYSNPCSMAKGPIAEVMFPQLEA